MIRRRHPARRRFQFLAIVAAVAVAAAGTGWWASRHLAEPAATHLGAVEADLPVTVAIESKTLRSEVITRGDVRFADHLEATVQGDLGAGVVTASPPAAGAVVHEGDRLVEIVGRPTFALTGELPMYRELGPGSGGDDVAQLQDALGRLGFAGNDTRGTFGPGTQRAVTAFYAARGAATAPASEAATDAATAAADNVAQAQADLATARASEARALGGTDPVDLTAARGEVDLTDRRLQEARGALDRAQRAVGVRIPQAEIEFLPRLPLTVERTLARRGSVTKGNVAVLTGGAIVVDATVDDAARSLVRPGLAARVIDDDAGTTWAATVATVASTPEASSADPSGAASTDGTSGSTAPARFSVRLLLAKPDVRAVGRNLRVVIPIASTHGRVLALPVAALYAGPQGQTLVQVQRRDGTIHKVAVRTGLVVDGEAEIAPDRALRAGTLVVVGSKRTSSSSSPTTTTTARTGTDP